MFSAWMSKWSLLPKVSFEFVWLFRVRYHWANTYYHCEVLNTLQWSEWGPTRDHIWIIPENNGKSPFTKARPPEHSDSRRIEQYWSDNLKRWCYENKVWQRNRRRLLGMYKCLQKAKSSRIWKRRKDLVFLIETKYSIREDQEPLVKQARNVSKRD